jgi:hypothetical protein
MFQQRRELLKRLLGAASVFSMAPFEALAQTTHPQPGAPQPLPSPNVPNPNVPAGLDGPQATPPDARAIDKARQQELKMQVSKLMDMVAELKHQVDYSDARTTLSIATVKKAQQIEKLAKQIKDLAKY